MFVKRLYIIFILLLIYGYSSQWESICIAQTPSVHDSLQNPIGNSSAIVLNLKPSPLSRYDYNSHINYWKLGGVTAAAFSTLGASYIYLKNTWWDQESQGFHFDNGADSKYAINLDKIAHFYGGAIGTDLFYGALRWSGMSEKGAYIYGAVLSSIVQIGMEVKDGFAPRWGFSFYDVSSGMLGALFPVSKRYIPLLQNIDIKLSYYRPSNHYLKKINTEGTWNDDYEGQTYWIAFKVNNLLPKSLEPIWLDFLGAAIGFSLDTDNDGHGGGHVEIFLGLDYDLTAILPSDSALWEGIKHYLNYIHLPAPAVRLTPSLIWFGLYF